MNRLTRFALVLLRVFMGCLFLYAGVSKIMNDSWSAAGFLSGAKTFTTLYHWFALPQNIGWVNILNEWGLTLLGVSLIIGLAVRVSSVAGIVLMFLYYFAQLQGVHPNPHALIVDEHIIYSAVLFLFVALPAGRIWGVDGWWVE